MAILLALVTLAVSVYYWRQMPYAFAYLLPANFGATGSLLFWIKPPARKKARRRAAFASLCVVPCIGATAALGFLFMPIEIWQVFGMLAFLALMLAIWAIVRVKRRASHPWADYYKQVGPESDQSVLPPQLEG